MAAKATKNPIEIKKFSKDDKTPMVMLYLLLSFHLLEFLWVYLYKNQSKALMFFHKMKYHKVLAGEVSEVIQTIVGWTVIKLVALLVVFFLTTEGNLCQPYVTTCIFQDLWFTFFVHMRLLMQYFMARKHQRNLIMQICEEILTRQKRHFFRIFKVMKFGYDHRGDYEAGLETE